ncbi:MAG: hypothetical protein JWR25_2205 [Noviherbaspirillum sp.]|nr:hypothetical protein [Noviherbaspirillum sp.]
MLNRVAYPIVLAASFVVVGCGGNAIDTAGSESGSPAPALGESVAVAAPESKTASETTVVAGAALRHLYVAVTGSDTNPGTQTQPFKTILKASQAATPGTVVHVAPGIYPGSFTTAKSGSATARITYVSDVKWGAKIVPPANSRLVAGWYNTGSYVDISGFEVDGSNYVAGQQWSLGIMIRGSYNVVSRNRVHHIATSSEFCNSTGGAGINTDTLQNGYHNDFIANLVHDIGVPGCNKIHGIYHSSSGKIQNNIIYQIGYGGIHLWHDASNIDISNNTVFGAYYGIIVGSGDYYKSTTGKVDYVNVSNNIIYDNIVGIVESGPSGTNNTYTNNLVYKSSKTNWAIRSAHSGDITADPQFVKYIRTGGGNYMPLSTSPAVGNGAPTYAPPTDYLGTPRPQGGKVDVGAFEYTGVDAR